MFINYLSQEETISQLNAGESTVTGSGSPGKVQPEHKTQDKEGQQEFAEEGENTDCGPGKPVSAGIGTRLAR